MSSALGSRSGVQCFVRRAFRTKTRLVPAALPGNSIPKDGNRTPEAGSEHVSC